MSLGSEFSLEPYKTAEEAGRAKKNILLTICGLIALQGPIFLFLWWISIQSIASQLPVLPTIENIFFLLVVVLLYYFNSRILASLLLAIISFGLVFTWINKVAITGDYAPPYITLLFAIVAVQLTISEFKLHAYRKTNNVPVPISKWVLAAIVGALLSLLIAYVVPIVHYWHYTRYQVQLTDFGSGIQYRDPLDGYGFDFSKTWLSRPVTLEYGSVELFPAYSTVQPSALVKIERWTPWDVPAVSLLNRDAFLGMANDEATKYQNENGAVIHEVKLIGPDNSTINAARAVYLNSDGSKRYIYYFYDKEWERQTSKKAWFFWRVIADIPQNSPNDEAEFESFIKTFRINGYTVDSTNKINLEQTRESFSFFMQAHETPIDELRGKIIVEVNALLKGNAEESKLFEAAADTNTYLQKQSNDQEIADLNGKMIEKYGKCWGMPEGSCSN